MKSHKTYRHQMKTTISSAIQICSKREKEKVKIHSLSCLPDLRVGCYGCRCWFQEMVFNSVMVICLEGI